PPDAWYRPRRRELGGCRHQCGGRVCDPLAVANPLDVGAGINQRPADPVATTDHPHAVAEAERLPESPLQAARQARVTGMPTGPAHGLVQHQRDHPAVDHALPALVALGHLELTYGAIGGRLETHLEALFVVLAAAPTTAPVGPQPPA